MQRATSTNEYGYIVVLGAPVRDDGTPGDDLAARLDVAARLLRAGDASSYVVVSGGAPTTYGSSGVAAEAVEFLVNTTTTGNQAAPTAAAARDNGNFVIAWKQGTEAFVDALLA